MTTDDLTSHVMKFGGDAHLTKWPKRVLWGVAPTGPPHFGYAAYIALLKLFARKGAEIYLLIANYHGFLDSEKIREEEISSRTAIYKGAFLQLGIRKDWLIDTDSFYFTPEYFKGLVEFSARLNIFDILDAGRTTLKRVQTRNRTFADSLYVVTQIFDIKHLQIDCVLCGQDEADIYRFGLPFLSNAEGGQIDSVYLPSAPGIFTAEMHASDPANNKLLLSADPSEIAAAFSHSPKLAAYHCQFTLPLLNELAPDNSEKDVSQAIFTSLRLHI